MLQLLHRALRTLLCCEVQENAHGTFAATVCATSIGKLQVRGAVAIHVRGDHSFENPTDADCLYHRWLKGSVAVAKEHPDIVGTAVHLYDIELAVTVEIGGCQRDRVIAAGQIGFGGLKGAIAVAQQHTGGAGGAAIDGTAATVIDWIRAKARLTR